MSAVPIDAHVPGSAEALRHAMGHFSSSVTIVTARGTGYAHAMTATAVSSVSLEPPLILVCVSRSSRFHDAVLAADGFAVSILSASQEVLARHFSRRGRRLETQFEGVAHFPAPVSGAPVLNGCLIWLDCRTYAAYDGGDHTILVGELVATTEAAAIEAPLTYYRGSYGVGRVHHEVLDPGLFS